jgi:hypothetical protein
MDYEKAYMELLLAVLPPQDLAVGYSSDEKRHHDAIQKIVRTAELANEHLKKWRDYENDYILPCFEWAKELGWDLEKMVTDNPGHNCVELLVEQLRLELVHAQGQRDIIGAELANIVEFMTKKVDQFRSLVKEADDAKETKG